MALLVGGSSSLLRAQTTLDVARQLYNQGLYDQAVAAAAKLRAIEGSADAANLVMARSYLERHRTTADRADLTAARDALRAVRPARLGSTDRCAYLIGLGEALYLDEAYGAAAEQFQLVLDRASEIGPRAFDRVFDWWASALERQTQSGPVDDRDAVFARIRDRAIAELARMPGLATASYWHVAACRALGDLGRAWDAAVAAWVRAPMAENGEALRGDLDRLVLQALIPERARELSPVDRDRDRAAAALKASWEAMKKDWGGV